MISSLLFFMQILSIWSLKDGTVADVYFFSFRVEVSGYVAAAVAVFAFWVSESGEFSFTLFD